MADNPNGDLVEIRVPAEKSFVAVIRSVTAALAARCDLTLDEIEDLRIAVDEACALLLPHAVAATPLVTKFKLGSGSLDVATTVQAEPAASPDRDGYAWTVLDALTNTVDVRSEGGVLSIELSKQRDGDL